ncbi:pilus assembly protein [Pseudomonas silvicola]|nr:pilus assembly protein [Pseudomonas silvicola]
MQAGLPHKQKGAAAIEFALVFMIFFAAFYAVVAYSLPLLMMQSFNEASAEAIRQTVAIDPTTAGTGYTAQVKSTAVTAVTTVVNKWLPTALNFSSSNVSVTYAGAGNLLTVTISYPSSNLNTIMPFLTLPGIGQVPNLPTNLTATSSMML